MLWGEDSENFMGQGGIETTTGTVFICALLDTINWELTGALNLAVAIPSDVKSSSRCVA